MKIEKRSRGGLLQVKCGKREGVSYDCKEYQINLDESEWETFQKMIYEFDFWTEEEFRERRGVADGTVYVLAGNRPDAERCNQMTTKIIIRSSPIYDKIGALNEAILSYEEQLDFGYY